MSNSIGEPANETKPAIGVVEDEHQNNGVTRGNELDSHFLVERTVTISNEGKRIDSTTDFNDFEHIKLFVDNVPFRMNNEGLREEFVKSQVPILEALIYRDGQRSRGCGYVVVPVAHAETLLLKGGPEVEGRKIGVHRFNPKRLGGKQAKKHDAKEPSFFSVVLTPTEFRVVQLFRLLHGQN
ncbi:hypothetical protein B0H10DRAFT_2189460 [Mycena sp. CBHHK59/15]|nr:hypothetical protein B0H10DRAFT_2189847 [Mycena sp. CBHHK59/15]KAJ6617837.1 hypothetical protein B0H10DRAFT_1948021 [Mycena sp. CBHHK59/15]KAJ6618627.1 hypothetical protein B0H10DRAFT_2189460 [Mycena sp. CBHHK59/15]